MLLAGACAAQPGMRQQADAPRLARSTTPRLLRRAAEESTQPQGDFQPGRCDLPDEASGTYALSPDPGEIIEMILNGQGEDCRLEGYLTRLGDGESDRGATLTYFFQQSSVSPNQLQFTTRLVHGVWWSFSGRIDRGSAARGGEKGLYFLNGTLMEHFDSGPAQARRVSLPSLPQGSRPLR